MDDDHSKKPVPGEIEEVKERLTEKWVLQKLVGKSPAFLDVVKKIPVVAKSDVHVLIQGETGTGKEVLARALHYLSLRKERPFVPVNSAALPAALLENELFGHTREAFTDAKSFRPGLVYEAERGTIFLDEVDTLERASQAKLLRFLEAREYRPLGSGKPIKADVRTIAACGPGLKYKVEAGAFRHDLFYRLNVISLKLPPLRERREDIPLLIHHFLNKYRAQFGKKGFSREALERFFHYDWPGNIRELENTVQRSMILASNDVMGPDSLPSWEQVGDGSGTCQPFQEAKRKAIETFERDYLAHILSLFNGNITRAAEAAGKDRRVFGRLVKKYKPFLDGVAGLGPGLPSER
jgi:DNA-binding NtrC family response regulator